MATYHFKCSVCSKDVSARSKYYKKYLGQYDCHDEEGLSRKYACRNCRLDRGEDLNPRKKYTSELEEYPKYNEVQGYISLEASRLAKRGINNEQARQLFLQNVKSILEREGVFSYNFVIEHNQLKGIKLLLPFVGEIIMNIETNKEV